MLIVLTMPVKQLDDHLMLMDKDHNYLTSLNHYYDLLWPLVLYPIGHVMVLFVAGYARCTVACEDAAQRKGSTGGLFPREVGHVEVEWSSPSTRGTRRWGRIHIRVDQMPYLRGSKYQKIDFAPVARLLT